MKRIFCLVICAALILSLCGCRKISEETSSNSVITTPMFSTDSKSVNLLYSYGDSFNPYTAKTAFNREISSLLYDSLIKTDNEFEVIYVLASSAEIKDKKCTVKLRDAKFTDGSTVTADDVIYSYKLAKESPRFEHSLYEIEKVTSPDSKTVIFSLTQHDPYFVNLLTFPILKNDSADETDSDGKEIPPIGCGRYVLSDDMLSFKQNKNYYGKKGVIETVNLIASPDAASTSHYVEVGAATVYFTEGDNIVRMSGKKADVNLNRLIYIGINDSYGSLKSLEMRYAISSALDRESICQSAYFNNATAATGFFNPSFKPTQALQTIESKPNTKITVENLSKIGYNNMNSNGFYANKSGNNPSFSLLVNSENSSRVAAAELIAAQCKTAGIQINVVKCSYEQYVSRLSLGHFQLYLGEVQLTNNMDFASLVTPDASAAFGVSKTDAKTENDKKEDGKDNDETADTETKKERTNSCAQILAKYHKGECGIGDVAGTLLTEMPQIPVCYLNGVLFYSSDITDGVQVSNSDIYLGFENYQF